MSIQQVQEATAVDILRVMKEDSATSVVDIWTKVRGLMSDVLVIKGLRDRVWLGKGSFQELALWSYLPDQLRLMASTPGDFTTHREDVWTS